MEACYEGVHLVIASNLHHASYEQVSQLLEARVCNDYVSYREGWQRHILMDIGSRLVTLSWPLFLKAS